MKTVAFVVFFLCEPKKLEVQKCAGVESGPMDVYEGFLFPSSFLSWCDGVLDSGDDLKMYPPPCFNSQHLALLNYNTSQA